jgi:hypothetical protein
MVAQPYLRVVVGGGGANLPGLSRTQFMSELRYALPQLVAIALLAAGIARPAQAQKSACVATHIDSLRAARVQQHAPDTGYKNMPQLVQEYNVHLAAGK